MKSSRRKVLAALAKGGTILATVGPGSLIAGCSSETAAYQPLAMSKRQFKFVQKIVDRILPTGVTPGGIESGADIFLDLKLQRGVNREYKDAYLSSLGVLIKHVKKGFSKRPEQMSNEECDELLSEICQPGNQHHAFFLKTKGLCLQGHYTSAIIGQEVLRYDPIPGAYKGCIPLDGNAWTIG